MRKIPFIDTPFFNQTDLEKAVHVMELCKIETPVYGLSLPFFAPGGRYGACWWSLDYALAVDGYKWIDPDCESELIENLAVTQCPDGRIKLYGMDNFDHIGNVNVPIASLPKYFETGYATFMRYRDADLRSKIFDVFEKSLIWWLTNRQDAKTHLISAKFEETFVPNLEFDHDEYAPMDTNMQIARACLYMSHMATILGFSEKQKAFHNKHDEIKNAIEQYLWNEEKAAYYPYLLKEGKHYEALCAHTFCAMMFDCAAPERKKALIDKLLDDSLFGWNTHTVTTVAKNDPLFVTVEGEYIGNPCWTGSVWTLTNKAIIQALTESSQKDIAAKLCVKTLLEFKADLTEFHHPFTGEGHGVEDYAWTAAQCLQILIEDIFGICYDAEKNKITIKPNLPEEYKNDHLSILGLILPDGNSLDVTLHGGTVKYKYNGNLKVII